MTNQTTKTHFIFVGDHSGSMQGISKAAMVDHNAVIAAVRDESSKHHLNTVCTVVQVGIKADSTDEYKVPAQMLSLAGVVGTTTRAKAAAWPKVAHYSANPHVLKPLENWPTPGQTPLWDGILLGIYSALAAPDAQREDQAFVLMVTTDGEDNASLISSKQCRDVLATLAAKGNWTFAFRVPRGQKYILSGLNLPEGAIQEWDTSFAGMMASTQVQKAAVANYMTSRAAGVRGSSAFYANAAGLDTTGLTEVPKADYSLYVVDEQGIEILPFVLKHRMKMLIGASYYQLTKTEARIGPEKKFILREKSSGKVFKGDVRKALGLPTTSNVRLHPGDHGRWDIFVQSTSTNRRLVQGSGLLYIPADGREMTDADAARYARPASAAPAVTPLLAVPASTRPTPSPITPASKASKAPQREFHASRSEARVAARAAGKRVKDHGAGAAQRWEVV